MSLTSQDNWANQVDLELPIQLDEIPREGMPYDRDLLRAMDLPVVYMDARPVEVEAPLKSPKSKTKEDTPIVKRTAADNINIFKASWGGLRKQCIEPKTTKTVIKTMRREVLMCVRDSQILVQSEVDMLDNEWDTLGTDRVSMFIGLFLEKNPVNSLTVSPGPFAYLKGMVDSMKVTHDDLFSSFLESQANIAADMNLASKSVESFRASMTEAEGIWREQSSLCSKYLSNLESQLKLIKIAADVPRPDPTPSSAAPKEPPQSSGSTPHYPFTYYYSGEKLQVKCLESATKKSEKIVAQVNYILDSVNTPQVFLSIHPEIIFNKFVEAYKRTKDARIAFGELMEALNHMASL